LFFFIQGALLRKCAVPTDHLRSQSSFSRTKNSPNLMSYIGRTALATPDC